MEAFVLWSVGLWATLNGLRGDSDGLFGRFGVALTPKSPIWMFRTPNQSRQTPDWTFQTKSKMTLILSQELNAYFSDSAPNFGLRIGVIRLRFGVERFRFGAPLWVKLRIGVTVYCQISSRSPKTPIQSRLKFTRLGVENSDSESNLESDLDFSESDSDFSESKSEFMDFLDISNYRIYRSFRSFHSFRTWRQFFWVMNIFSESKNILWTSIWSFRTSLGVFRVFEVSETSERSLKSHNRTPKIFHQLRKIVYNSKSTLKNPKNP